MLTIRIVGSVGSSRYWHPSAAASGGTPTGYNGLILLDGEDRRNSPLGADGSTGLRTGCLSIQWLRLSPSTDEGFLSVDRPLPSNAAHPPVRGAARSLASERPDSRG